MFYIDLVIYLANLLQNCSRVLKLEGLTAFPRLQPSRLSFGCVCVQGTWILEARELSSEGTAQLDAVMTHSLEP